MGFWIGYLACLFSQMPYNVLIPTLLILVLWRRSFWAFLSDYTFHSLKRNKSESLVASRHTFSSKYLKAARLRPCS